MEDIITFGKPSFLAMATTATTKNTDNVSLFADLVTTAVILKNDPALKLKLNQNEMNSLLALVENEAKKVPNIEKGKEILQRIIENKIPSADDQAFFNEYLDALKENPTILLQHKNLQEIINKIINSAKLLSSKGVEVKNLLVNLEDTVKIVEKINITEDYLQNNTLKNNSDEPNVTILKEDNDELGADTVKLSGIDSYGENISS